MAGNKKFTFTKRQELVLKETRKVVMRLKGTYGGLLARWAINRVMREDTERRGLIREKENAEQKLREIEARLV